jgi:hypothetical protein
MSTNRKNLIFLGLLFFSIILLVEHIWLGQANIVCFVKGFGSGIILVGMVKHFFTTFGKSKTESLLT